MSLADIKEWVEFIWPFISPLAALLCTFTLVSFFKSILKHYKRDVWDKFTLTLVIRIIAFITGFSMAFIFLRDLDNAEQWAIGLAILNIPIYSGILKYAASKQWLPLIALLKGRKLSVRQEGDTITEKITDDDDLTMITREYRRKDD